MRSGKLPGVAPEDGGVPPVGLHQAERDADQRGLAGAVGPHDGEELARAEVEAHVLQHLGLAEADRDVVHVQRRHGRVRAGGRRHRSPSSSTAALKRSRSW
jgi:hypothetical protein